MATPFCWSSGMSKLAPAHALPAAESLTQGHTADAAAAAIARATRRWPMAWPTW